MGAEPGGEVCHRTDCSVVVASLEADPSERRVPGLYPDTEPQLDPSLSPHCDELVESLVRGDREPDGTELVIAQWKRVVEEHRQPLSGKMFERSSMRRDQPPDCILVLAQHAEELLGSSRLGVRSEPTEVTEEAGDVGPVTVEKALAALARNQLRHLRGQEPGKLRALPLDRFEQAGVRERDRRLVGEGLQERDVGIAERSRLAAHEDDDADQILIDLDRHAKQGSEGERAGIDVLGVVEDVPDVDRLSGESGAAGSGRSVDRVRMLAVVLGTLGLAVMGGYMQELLVEEIERAVTASQSRLHASTISSNTGCSPAEGATARRTRLIARCCSRRSSSSRRASTGRSLGTG